jgi:hypothetical protein
MTLIQEPWYREGRIMGLNIPGCILFCASGTDRPRACILARDMNIWMLRDSLVGRCSSTDVL